MLGTDTNSTGSRGDLKSDFESGRLVSTLATGLVLAFVNALLSIALMALIFTGDLQEALPVGIGAGLLGSAAIALVIALRSSFPGMYAGIQDNSAAILALSAASIAASIAASETLDTVLALIVVTTLATGTMLVVMARFRLGEIARFVPFPVIGGLLAGTGYLITIGALAILWSGESVGDVFGVQAAGLLWPGLALAGILLIAAHRGWPSRIYLAAIVLSVAGFHVVTRILGASTSLAFERGWLLGPLPSRGLWPGLGIQTFAGADWGAIAGQAGGVATILIVVPLTILLSVSALETETNTDLDLERELSTTGWANLASGFVGGPPGYFYMSDTLIAHRLVGGRRGSAVIAGLIMMALVFIGGGILEFLPQFVIGGLLLFVGTEFLVDWLWIARRRMSTLDYGLMVGIVVVVAIVGFLPGVVTGLVAAIVLFVYRYSRIDVVKHAMTAAEMRSNIERPPAHADHLRSEGGSVLVLELQGFIFFGTANQIFRRLQDQIALGGLRIVVLDFALTTGVDSSAVSFMKRVGSLARDSAVQLVLTGLKPEKQEQLSEFISTHLDVVRIEPDLDHGLAWCEEKLLEGIDAGDTRQLPAGLSTRLYDHLTNRTLPAGTKLMKQGDPAPGIFLIVAGRATVFLEGADGAPPRRLRTLLEGTVLGEISLYREEPCTATVVADTECEVLHLTPEAFNSLCLADPVGAAELHAFVARTLAGRVSHANETIRALHD